MAKWGVSVKRKLALENLASVYCVCGVPSEQVAIADQMHHSYSKLTRLPFQPGFQPCLGRAVGILCFSQQGDMGPPILAMPNSPVVPCMW